MKVFLIKLAAYVLLIVGILLGIGSFLGGIGTFFAFPEANTVKSVSVGIGLIIAAFLFGAIAYGVFEALIGAAKKADGGSAEETTWRSNKDGK